MRKWVWRILLAVAVMAALTVGALAADETVDWSEMTDGVFNYEPIYVTGSTTNSKETIKAYRVLKYIGDERQEVTIPDRFHGKPVTEIGGQTADITTLNAAQLQAASVFAGSKLNGVVKIPNSVTAINSGAFSYAAMRGVEIPGSVEVIGTCAFAECSAMTDIRILDYADDNGEIYPNHTTIKAHAFENCGYIKSLEIPNSVSTISNSAFKGCSGLIDLILPYSVKTIEADAFAECRNLLNITVLGSNVKFADTAFEWKDIFAAKDSKPGGYFHCAYSDTVTNIGDKIDSQLSALSWTMRQTYKARVHVVTVQNDGLTVTGRTTPLCKAYGPNGKVALSFTCNGYNETVQKVDKDGKPMVDDKGQPVMETVHRDCTCYGGKNSYSQSHDVSAVYHDERPITEVVDATCSAPGRKGGTTCAICGKEIEPPETTPATGVHSYTSDSETETEHLFSGHCEENGPGVEGLDLITKKCVNCGYKPVCWQCEELKWKLEDADAGLTEAKAELAEATAKAEAAGKEAVRADEAAAEAAKALTGAQEAMNKAQTAYQDAQTAVTAARAALDALGADATEEEREAAQEKLDEAVAEEAKALKAYQDAETEALQAQIKKNSADAAAAKALADKTAADADKAAAQNKVTNDTSVVTAQGNLRTHVMGTNHAECAECGELLAAIRSAKTPEAKQQAEDAYTAHKATPHTPKALPSGTISGKKSDVPGHDWGEDVRVYPAGSKVPTCITGKPIVVTFEHTCRVCGKTEASDREPEVVRPADKHTPPANVGVTDTPATCTTPGKKVYEDYECVVCGEKVKGSVEVIDPLGHLLSDPVDKTEGEATCQEDCVVYKNYQKCQRCDFERYDEAVVSKGAHKWGNPEPDPDKKDQDEAATCGKPGVSHVIVTCTVCGEKEAQTIEIPATGVHTWGDWVVTKKPTATEPGEETRACSACGKKDVRAISATGDPIDPGPDDPDKPKPEDTVYKINLVQASNGTSSVSKTTAKKGETITVTYTPDSGYVLDMIRVIAGSTSLVSYRDLGGGRFQFTMPEADVEVRVTFDREDSDYSENWGDGFGNDASGGRSDPRRTTDIVPTQVTGHSVPKADAHDQVFQDVPTGHWAAGEITWASDMGYMSGSNGRFNPDGPITHQQMWMVLARLTGANPASMAEARTWAVRGGYADGSSPTGAVKRHQLVTALYRCARLTSGASRVNASLAGFVDSGAVPARAREAFTWALSSGVVNADANKRLNPNKNLTRAEAAVILYCYSQRF